MNDEEPITSQELFDKLAKVLALPKDATWVTVILEVGEPVIIECGYVSRADADSIIEGLRTYELRQKEVVVRPVEDAARGEENGVG